MLLPWTPVNAGQKRSSKSGGGAPDSKALLKLARLRVIQEILGTSNAGQIVPTGRTALETLFDGLRLDLQNIARTARSIAQEQPGFADAFRLPDPPTDRALLTTADSFISQLAVKMQDGKPVDDAATQARKAAIVAQFVAHEMPADFVTHLQTDVQAIRDEYKLLEKQREIRVRSTATFGPVLKEANEIITTLDAIMHNKYTRDAAKLRAWKSSSHLERAPRRKNDKKDEPPTPPTPTPTA